MLSRAYSISIWLHSFCWKSLHRIGIIRRAFHDAGLLVATAAFTMSLSFLSQRESPAIEVLAPWATGNDLNDDQI